MGLKIKRVDVWHKRQVKVDQVHYCSGMCVNDRVLGIAVVGLLLSFYAYWALWVIITVCGPCRQRARPS